MTTGPHHPEAPPPSTPFPADTWTQEAIPQGQAGPLWKGSLMLARAHFPRRPQGDQIYPSDLRAG